MIADNQAAFIFQENSQDHSLICGIPNPFSEQQAKVRRDDILVDNEEKDVENYLAASMNKLSVKDREKILEDIHGVAKADPEEETTVRIKLLKLEAHLSDRKRGTAYERAEQIDPSYTSNRDFRMMFLRSNDYDSVAAAEQILRFFDMKQSLFGEEKLTQRITLDTLDDGVKQCLQAGYTQFVEPKDAVSRQIILFLPGLKIPHADVETEMKTLFYFLLSTLESIQTQKRGFIVILYAIGQYKDMKRGMGAGRLGSLAISLPLRFCSIHMCCSDPVEYVINRAAIRILPASTAAKIRIHLGSHFECQYALRGYGIPSASLPISPVDFSPDMINHRKWYQQRIKLEREWKLARPIQGGSGEEGEEVLILDSPLTRVDDDGNGQNGPRSHSTMASAIVQPQPTDVLFGRGYMMHPGNIQMRQLVTENSHGYELACGKHQKIEAAGRLVDQLKSNGVRFLVYDTKSGQWITATNAEARNKVAKTIRNRRRARRPT